MMIRKTPSGSNSSSKTKKIKVPRNLRASAGKFEFEFDEYPFLEVKVEPGENSDPSKLEFTFTADFTDS